MLYGRLELRRATLTVCVFILLAGVIGFCSGQSPAEKTPAGDRSASGTTPSPPQAGGNTLPPGAPAKSTAKTGEAGPLKAAAAKTPPTTASRNPAPPAKSGAVSGAERGAAVRSSKTTTSEPSVAAGRRDPFKAWVAPSQVEHSASVPPPSLAGPRGLVISGLRLTGTVRQEPGDEMIAVVTNYTKRAYFLRVNDTVYNGVVSKITREAVYFKENTLDSRGQMITREVEIKLGSAPGEGR